MSYGGWADFFYEVLVSRFGWGLVGGEEDVIVLVGFGGPAIRCQGIVRAGDRGKISYSV